jgi:cyclic pyranopterin phosphate synthase
MSGPTHLTPDGRLSMVDVSQKPPTQRSARAQALVRMNEPARAALQQNGLPKGDALAAAEIAGIVAAKQTATLIPLCHALALSKAGVAFGWTNDGTLRIEATAQAFAQTGVEMEALMAAAIAALTVYDMVKALDRGVVIESVRLLEKRGGKSGTWTSA